MQAVQHAAEDQKGGEPAGAAGRCVRCCAVWARQRGAAGGLLSARDGGLQLPAGCLRLLPTPTRSCCPDCPPALPPRPVTRRLPTCWAPRTSSIASGEEGGHGQGGAAAAVQRLDQQAGAGAGGGVSRRLRWGPPAARWTPWRYHAGILGGGSSSRLRHGPLPGLVQQPPSEGMTPPVGGPPAWRPGMMHPLQHSLLCFFCCLFLACYCQYSFPASSLLAVRQNATSTTPRGEHALSPASPSGGESTWKISRMGASAYRLLFLFLSSMAIRAASVSPQRSLTVSAARFTESASWIDPGASVLGIGLVDSCKGGAAGPLTCLPTHLTACTTLLCHRARPTGRDVPALLLSLVLSRTMEPLPPPTHRQDSPDLVCALLPTPARCCRRTASVPVRLPPPCAGWAAPRRYVPLQYDLGAWPLEAGDALVCQIWECDGGEGCDPAKPTVLPAASDDFIGAATLAMSDYRVRERLGAACASTAVSEPMLASPAGACMRQQGMPTAADRRLAPRTMPAACRTAPMRSWTCSATARRLPACSWSAARATRCGPAAAGRILSRRHSATGAAAAPAPHRSQCPPLTRQHSPRLLHQRWHLRQS